MKEILKRLESGLCIDGEFSPDKHLIDECV